MTIKNIVKSIDNKEWRLLFFLTIALIIITTLPYIFAYLTTPDDHFYYGKNSMISGDISVYYSYINQVKEGNWLFKNYYSIENQPIGTLNIFWLTAGLVAKIFDLSAIFVFQMYRILMVPLLMFILYLFIAYIQPEKIKRKISLIFLCFGSGVGAYAVRIWPDIYYYGNENMYNWPADLWVAEGSLFTAIYNSGHFILSLSLMIFFFLLMLLAVENWRYKYSIFAGLVGLLWFNFHPYYFPLVFLVTFCYYAILFFKTRKLQILYYYLIALALCLPSVLYHYYLIATDFVIGGRAGQNITLTSPLIFVIFGFGCLLYLSFLGLYLVIRNKQLFENNKTLFIVCWFIVGIVIIYSPIFFQRRLVFGLQIPVVLLSCEIIYFLKNKLNKFFSKFRPAINRKLFYPIYFGLFILLFGISPLYIITRDFHYFSSRQRSYYLPNDLEIIVDWLKGNNSDNKVILSDPFYSNLLPGFINQKVYCGHTHETIFFDEKNKNINEYYLNQKTIIEEMNFIEENDIGYLINTNFVNEFFNFNPKMKFYWKEVFKSGEITIYEYNP